MVMAPDALEATEAAETPEEDLTQPDPVEERLSKIESFHQSLANQIGYMGRAIDRLMKEPQTATIRAELAAARTELADVKLAVKLRDMDSEEKASYLQELRGTEAAAKAAAAARQAPDEAEFDNARYREFEPWGKLLKEEAESEGLDYDRAIITRSDWPKVLGPDGYAGFYRQAQKCIANATDEKKARAKPLPKAPLDRGGSTSSPSWAQAQKITKLSDLTAEAYEKLIAAG